MTNLGPNRRTQIRDVGTCLQARGKSTIQHPIGVDHSTGHDNCGTYLLKVALGGSLHDLATSDGRARKGNFVDVRVRCEGRATHRT